MPVTLATRRLLAEDFRFRSGDVEALKEVIDAVQALSLLLPDAARRVSDYAGHKALQELQSCVEDMIHDHMPSLRNAMENIEKGVE